MRSGWLYPRPQWAPHTSANASSSSPTDPGLPTPRARDAKGPGYPDGLPAVAALLPTPSASEATGTGHTARGGMNLRHTISLLPTPRATDTGTPGRRASEDFRPPLSQVVLPLLPTPLVGDSKGARQATAPNPRSPQPTLTDLAFSGALLPTPRASDGEKGGPNQRGSKGDLALPDVAHRIGDLTPPRSRGGKRSSDAPPPGQLTLWDA